MSESCKSCRFWLQQERWPVMGYCRRYPPQFCFDGESGDQAFPAMQDDQWCGEYRLDTGTSAGDAELKDQQNA